MPSRFVVHLSDADRQQLTALTRRGHTSAQRLTRARALLLSAGGATDVAIGAALGIHPRTVARLRQRAVEDGVLDALADRPRPGAQPCLDDHQQAYLIALACTDPPTGRSTWTLQLLADRLVAVGVVETVSADTVGRTLKKTSCSPGASSSGASPA